ncbi:hypothetical protein H2201_008297, partial [Coniosporium apollinis]
RPPGPSAAALGIVRQQGEQPVVAAPLATPLLMRESSYDRDTKERDERTAGFYDNEDSTVDGRFGEGQTGAGAEIFRPGLEGRV